MKQESDLLTKGDFGSSLECLGGFVCPPAAEVALKAKSQELGVPVPDDTEFGYMKD